MNNIEKKIRLSNKIYPYLQGFSDDLLFWAAINMIFLTTVKLLSASQISILAAISSLGAILLQKIVLKIVKKIGNINSVKLGLVLLLLSAIFITFGSSFIMIAIGEVLYSVAFLFKGMDSVILKRNLKYLNEEDLFIEIQSKSSMIYAIVTLIIAIIAGFIFNINNYLPMFICITICIINIIVSNFLYECEFEEEKTENNEVKFKWTKILFLIILLYGLLYGTLETAQENAKIFIQYTLQRFESTDNTAIYLSLIIAISRIFRVLANFTFTKIYKKIKNKFIIVVNISLIFSLALLIIGNLVPFNNIGIMIMAFGFCMLLWTRDPIMNFLKNELLNNTSKEIEQIAMLKFNLFRKIVRLILALLVSFILLKVEMIYMMIILLILSVIYILFTINLYKMLEEKNNDRGLVK